MCIRDSLKVVTGIDILHVPYRGNADALNDLLAGTIQMMNEINPMPHVRAGKLTLLDISHTERHPDFPGVPTIFELGYGKAYVPSWYAMWAPAGTPREPIEAINAKVNEISRTDDMRRRMLAINVALVPQSTEDMVRHYAEDRVRVADLIKLTGVKAE